MQFGPVLPPIAVPRTRPTVVGVKRFLVLPFVLLGCSSAPAPVPGPSTLPAPATAAPALPEPALLASARLAVGSLLTGADPTGFLVGDRLMIITNETFSEIHASVATNFLAAPFSLGSGCPEGACLTSAREFLASLLSDLENAEPATAPVPVPTALSDWSSVVAAGPGRIWRVHLADDGSRLVAVEFFGPVPLTD